MDELEKQLEDLGAKKIPLEEASPEMLAMALRRINKERNIYRDALAELVRVKRSEEVEHRASEGLLRWTRKMTDAWLVAFELFPEEEES